MFARGVVLCLSGVLTGTSALAQTCTVKFDFGCPTAVSSECGAFFDGAGGCQFAALPFCYDSGSRSYKVTITEPLTITIPGGISELTVFLANQGDTPVGQMRFFDAEVGGNEVGTPISATGDCMIAMPPRQTQDFATPVLRVEVTATAGTIWLDTFEITPVPDCSALNECSGHGTCIADDICQCDEGFTSANCGAIVPAVSQWGLIMLTLLLATAATVLLGTRRYRTAP